MIHTKGKWESSSVITPNGEFYKVFSDNVSICNITTRDSQQAAANAKLIAASPEMLELLKLSLKGLEVTNDSRHDWLRGSIRELIKTLS